MDNKSFAENVSNLLRRQIRRQISKEQLRRLYGQVSLPAGHRDIKPDHQSGFFLSEERGPEFLDLLAGPGTDLLVKAEPVDEHGVFLALAHEQGGGFEGAAAGRDVGIRQFFDAVAG